ncbi:dockerin type I repeat-containing protein [bacterium]|nr:dockerin type I repeat-containing protein [candidate division CSSED10-310 bacterium]
MLVSIRAFSNADVFACGDYGYIRHFDGSSWSLTELETPSPLQCIDGMFPDDLWVCGLGGFMAHFNGTQWTQVSSGTTADISDLHVLATDEIYASTRQGELLFYDGDKWSIIYSPSLARFNAVYRDSESETVWLTGDAGVVMRLDTQATPTPEPCVHDGDVTLDGVLTAGDAQAAFQIVLGGFTPTVEEACAADCNGDDAVTAGDAQNIFMAVLGTAFCEDPV